MSDDEQHSDESTEEEAPDLGASMAESSLNQEDSSIDAELESMATGDAESLLAEGAAQDILDQNDMEERLDGAADDSPMESNGEELVASKEDLLDTQDDIPDNIDALLAGAPVEESTPTDDMEISLDELAAALDASDPSESTPTDDVEISLDELAAALDTSGPSDSAAPMDDVDISLEELEAAINASSLPPDPDLESDVEISLEELEAAVAEVSSEEVISEVAGENIAAGAAPDSMIDEPQIQEASPKESASVSEPDPEAVIPEEAVAKTPADSVDASEAEDSSEPKIRSPRQWAHIPATVVHIAREEPWRAITSLAAGLIVALSTYLYIATNELQDVRDYRDIAMTHDSDLQRAITAAQFSIQEKDYTQASERITQALAKADPQSPLYADAEYVKLEANMKALPETLSTLNAQPLHSNIDRLVTRWPLHKKRDQALFWKGQLYETEDNLQAARVEYRNFLNQTPNADIRYKVLMALGALELKTDRPVEAAKYLQQLRANFPGTNEALQARLLVADAYAAIGDLSSARTTYIAIAQAHPNEKIGADAFARLGELAFNSGNYDLAIRELEGRLNTARTVEGNDGVTLLLAKAYRASGRLEDAKNMLSGLIDFFPTSTVTPLARIEMSQVLDELSLGREAARYATETVQIFPGHPAVLRNAGELLTKHGDALDAARALLAAHTAGADDPDLLLSAGRLLLNSGATQEAQKAFEQLLTHYPKTQQGIMGNVELAKLSFDAGYPTDAINRLEELQLLLRTSAQQLPVLLTLGTFYRELGLINKIADTYGEIAVLTNEPEIVARAAIELLNAGVTTEGLTIAADIEVQQLSDATAYSFLSTKGHSLLTINPKEGLAYLEQAHAGYPTQRTAPGVQNLLEANLTLDRSARARALVSELKSYVAQREHFNERPRLEHAATTWGNYLYQRQDYRAAANAYAMVLEAQPGTTLASTTLNDTQNWSLFQRANALYRLSDYAQCIPLYERLAASASPWVTEATAKLTSAKLEQRMRGITVPETRNAG